MLQLLPNDENYKYDEQLGGGGVLVVVNDDDVAAAAIQVRIIAHRSNFISDLRVNHDYSIYIWSKKDFAPLNDEHFHFHLI